MVGSHGSVTYMWITRTPQSLPPIYLGQSLISISDSSPSSYVSRHLVFPATDENVESNTCSAVGHCLEEMKTQWFPLLVIPPAMDNLKHSRSTERRMLEFGKHQIQLKSLNGVKLLLQKCLSEVYVLIS